MFGHASICISQYEADVLKRFFMCALQESESGYVIEGVKPLCVLGVDDASDLCVGYPIHKNSLIFKKGLEIWNAKLAKHNEAVSIRIKTYDRTDSSVKTIKHLLFVNKPLFIKTIDENLFVFKYALGPRLTSQSFYDTLVNSSKSFSEVFGGHNNVLVGIALGYGTDNALTVSRLEDLQLCKDPSQASFGFDSLEEEKLYLSDLVSLPPEILTNKKPYFLYGCKKNDPSVDEFHKKLISAQTNICSRMNDPEFLQHIVQLLTGERLIIYPDAGANYSVDKYIENIVAKALIKSLNVHGYSKENIKKMIQEMEAFLSKKIENPPENKSQDIISFYRKYKFFDFEAFLTSMKCYLDNPHALTPGEQIKLENFYSVLYEL